MPKHEENFRTIHLLIALRKQDEAIRLIEESNISLDYMDSSVDQEPLLTRAAFNGTTKVIQWLIEHGANIFIKGTYYKATALQIAIILENIEVAGMLLYYENLLPENPTRGETAEKIENTKSSIRRDEAAGKHLPYTADTFLAAIQDAERLFAQSKIKLSFSGDSVSSEEKSADTATDVAGITRIMAGMALPAGRVVRIEIKNTAPPDTSATAGGDGSGFWTEHNVGEDDADTTEVTSLLRIRRQHHK